MNVKYERLNKLVYMAPYEGTKSKYKVKGNKFFSGETNLQDEILLKNKKFQSPFLFKIKS